MKKLICIFVAVFVLLSLTACESVKDKDTTSTDSTNNQTPSTPVSKSQPIENDSEPQPATSKPEQTEKPKSADGIDVDLTTLSSTAVYAEVWNMMAEPESYIGKTVKMKGIFAVYEDETTGQKYFACIIADALGCCQQGLEFILKGEHKYPDDYPTVDSEITVTGTFETYTEDKFTYCRIKDAVMN